MEFIIDTVQKRNILCYIIEAKNIGCEKEKVLDYVKERTDFDDDTLLQLVEYIYSAEFGRKREWLEEQYNDAMRAVENISPQCAFFAMKMADMAKEMSIFDFAVEYAMYLPSKICREIERRHLFPENSIKLTCYDRLKPKE